MPLLSKSMPQFGRALRGLGADAGYDPLADPSGGIDAWMKANLPAELAAAGLPVAGPLTSISLWVQQNSGLVFGGVGLLALFSLLRGPRRYGR